MNLTNMESKEERVLELFYNSSKQWHFEELMKKAKISRPQLAHWLKKFEKEGILKRSEQKGKMPYYVQDFNNAHFQQKKILFARKKMTESGLLSHLASLTEAKAVIVFGSFTRPDWYEGSDIDVFIYGNGEAFEQGKYELKLKREIQVHTAGSKEDLKRMDKLLPYILAGNFVKGSIGELGIEVHV